MPRSTGESVSWRPRRVDGVVLIQRPGGSRSKKGQCFGLSKQVRKSRCPGLRTVRQEELPLPWGGSLFLFNSGLPLIGGSPRTLGKVICFTQSIDLNVNPSENTLTEIPQIMFDQISGPPMAQSSWPMKWTITNIRCSTSSTPLTRGSFSERRAAVTDSTVSSESLGH